MSLGWNLPAGIRMCVTSSSLRRMLTSIIESINPDETSGKVGADPDIDSPDDFVHEIVDHLLDLLRSRVVIHGDSIWSCHTNLKISSKP